MDSSGFRTGGPRVPLLRSTARSEHLSLRHKPGAYKVSVSVPSRVVGLAVGRSRARRRVRAAVRELGSFPRTGQYLFVVGHDISALQYKALQREVHALLEQIRRRPYN